MAVPVQLAFQGGGARLAAFFPAIIALQTLEIDKVISVKRVSGASAGAIAAALFAGRANIPAVIEYCKGLQAQKALMKKLFPKPDISTRTGKLNLGYQFWSQKPLADESELARVLADAFTAGRVNAETVGKLDIPCLITSANLINHQPVVAASSNALVQSLVNSAALPFFFRMMGETVDGGILDNLPVEALRDDTKLEPDRGEIIAISFKQDGYATQVKSPIQLGLRLIESSINARTAYSKAQLGEDRVVEIPTKFDNTTISTFDVDGFFKICNSAGIQENITRYVSDWFTSYKNRRSASSTVVADSAVNESHDQTKIISTQSSKLRRLASKYHETNKIRLTKTILEVTAFSLSKNSGLEDRFDYLDEFYVKERPFFAHVTRLFASNSGHVSQNELNIRDENGNELPVVSFSVPDDVGNHNWVLAMLEDPIMPSEHSNKYTLHSKQLSGSAMRPLIDKGHDYLAIQVTQAEFAEIAEIRLFVPSEIDLTMRNGTRDLLRVLNIEEEQAEENEILADGVDLSRVSIDVRHCPPGFKAYVWQGKNIEKGGVLRVIFTRNEKA